MAQDALRGVFAFAGILVHFDFHWTYLYAFSTLDAFALIAMDTEQRKVTHRLEEDCDGADIFAEGAVVLE